MHSAGRKVSKSDTIVNIIISADGPSRLGTTIQYEYHVYTTQVHLYGIYWGTYNNINANDDGANTHIRTNTHTHTRARTHAYTYTGCIAHIIIIFRTPLYCLRVSHMHGAPSLMVLTIWMQISERKPPKGFGVRRAQQHYNFVPYTRQRRRRRRLRTAGRHQNIFHANFHDIFRFPYIIIIVLDHGQIRCRKVTTG